jgi:hypothetical protein
MEIINIKFVLKNHDYMSFHFTSYTQVFYFFQWWSPLKGQCDCPTLQEGRPQDGHGNL